MSTDDRATRFRDVVHQHEPGLRSYVARRVPGEAIDDIVQEVLLVAWNRFDELESAVPAEAHRPWLLGVARHGIARHFRTTGRRAARERRVTADPALAAATAADDHAEDHARAELVERALGALPADDRDLLLASLWDGLSTAEIAGVHGLTEAAVRKRLSRARARLRASAPGLLSEVGER